MRILCLIILGLLFAANARAEMNHQEYYPLVSATLPDTDMLNGKPGTPVTLAGVLRFPNMMDIREVPDKLPAVVLLHGSGGVQGWDRPVEQWATEFLNMGVAVFLLDSFSGRGILETVTEPTRLGRLNMVVDAYRALEFLSKHRQIDPARIALMGMSRGGQSSFYASMARFYKSYGPPGGLQFAAHISMYPSCNMTLHGDEDLLRPVRILHGTIDDYTPIAACRSYVERLKKARQDVDLIEYPGAGHVFDGPGIKKPMHLGKGVTTRNCSLVEGDKGVVLNQKTGKPFNYDDPCVERGPTVAYNEKASEGAHRYVRDYLKRLFKLD